MSVSKRRGIGNANASDAFDELPSEAHAIWADEALAERTRHPELDEESTRHRILCAAPSNRRTSRARRPAPTASGLRGEGAQGLDALAETEPLRVAGNHRGLREHSVRRRARGDARSGWPVSERGGEHGLHVGKLREALATRKVNITKFDQEKTSGSAAAASASCRAITACIA